MTIVPIFQFLYSILSKSKNWIKAWIVNEKGESVEFSNESMKNYGNMSVSNGDINIYNINLNIVIDPNSPDYNKEQLNEFIRGIKAGIDSHETALGLDNEIVRSENLREKWKLSEIQINQMKKFKEAGWSTEKLTSITLAYRIINAEDAGKCDDAKNIMVEAFKGRKQSINRKMYNLARSEYLEQFALDLLYSSALTGDETISKILDYFPEAIFIDQDFMDTDLINDLQRRENEDVKKVVIHVRGERRISLVESAYKKYADQKEYRHINMGEQGKIYQIHQNTKYVICDTNAKKLDLILSQMPRN